MGENGARLVLRAFPGPEAAPRILILHGFWRSGLSPRMRHLAVHFSDRYRVYILDLRGHGGSEGLFRFGALEVADLSHVLALLGAEDASPLGLLGFSMGGQFAASVLGAYPHFQETVGSCALVSSPVDPARLRLPWWDPTICRGIRLSEVWRVPRFLPPHLIPGRPNPLELLPRVGRVPKLIVHSVGDWLVPREDAEAYYEAASAPKRLVPLENRHRCHADALLHFAPEPTLALLDEWFRETLLDPSGR